MDKSEIASNPEMSLFIMGYGTDHCIRVAFKNGFQPGGLVVQFIDMFDIIDIGQVLLMIERDKGTHNIFPFLFGDGAEFLLFEVILVDVVSQE